jgi:predicted DNA-binding antitoxin AbrB/MazE fold protein
MTHTFDATYENGALKLEQPLPLQDHQRVRVTVEAELPSLVAAQGILAWRGDRETLRRIAEDPEFDPLESA